jgi:hypothetical protein
VVGPCEYIGEPSDFIKGNRGISLQTEVFFVSKDPDHRVRTSKIK